jgi:hypothetical protein
VAESFSVGDVVEIFQHPAAFIDPTHAIGREGTIVALYVDTIFGLQRHRVDCGDRVFRVTERCLRKKQPPQPREQVSTWDDVIVWRPKETSHV